MKANGGPTDHGEWFAVPEGVALETVRRWRDFVKEILMTKMGLSKVIGALSQNPGA